MRIIIVLSLVAALISCQQNGKDQKTLADSAISVMPKSRLKRDSVLSQQELEAFVKSASHVTVNRSAKAPFNRLNYNKIIAYDFDGSKGVGLEIMDSAGIYSSTIVRQTALTKQQADSITNILSENETYGNGTAACFNPHLGLIFYQDNKPVARISVCLDCNYLSSSVPIPATSHKIMKGANIPLEGFSKAGRKQIGMLVKQLGFSHSGL